MPAALGATFIRQARKPLEAAGDLLWTAKVADALALLTRPRLEAALQQAIAVTARRAGARRSLVDRLLPGSEVESALAELGAAQEKAAEVWSQYSGRLGGFLTGVADVTTVKGQADVGFYLMRLGAKVSRDKLLAGPLHEMSEAVKRWERLIAECGRLVDADPALRQAKTWRSVRRTALLVAPLPVVTLSLWFGLRLRASRARVDAAIGAADPCAVEALGAADLERAAAVQVAAVADRRRACAEGRTAAERALAEQKAAVEYEAHCTTLAGDVEAGKLTGEDATLAGDQAPFLTRVAGRALDSADFGATPALPCARSPSFGRLQAAMAKAACASTQAWGGIADLSPELRGQLTACAPPPSVEAKAALKVQAEKAAKQGVLQGEPAAMSAAAALCDLEEGLGVTLGSWCRGLRYAASKGR